MKKKILWLFLPVLFCFLLMPAFVNQTSAALADTTLGEAQVASGGKQTSYDASGTTISCSASGGSFILSYSSTLTITLTNNRTKEADLSFNYDIVLGGGSLIMAGESITADGQYSFSKSLSAGESIQIELTSKKGSGTASLTITGLNLSEAGATVSVKFLAPSGGTYTVDGVAITEEKTITKLQTEEYKMVATVASGYKFVGWYDVTNGVYKSYDTTYNSLFNSDVTLQPVFVTSDTAIFGVGEARFLDLNEADAYATASNQTKIVLISSGAISANDGGYTISAGKSLIIPFDAAYTMETTPGIADASTLKEFSKLTLKDGAHITCDGTIYVGAKICAASGGSNARSGTTGAYGRIQLDSGSSITMNIGSTLYAYGFVTGEGTVTAKGNASTGATVYEIFELREFRGGDITNNMQGNEQGVLPFSQYYFQNIGASLVMEAGITLTGYTAAKVSVFSLALDAAILGPNDGIFVLEEGTVTKSYDPATDRCKLEIDGTFRIGSTTIQKGYGSFGININTADYVMPINGHFDIHIKNDSQITIPVNVELLPGVVMTIDKDASVTVGTGTNLYLYDSATWCADNYVFSGKTMAASGFYPGRTYTRSAVDLVDAKMVVNGTLNVNGNLYTTAGGANITSDGNGVVNFVTDAGADRAIYQTTSGTDNFVSINTTSAQLRNSDATYVGTKSATAGIQYTYEGTQLNGKWVSNAVASVVNLGKDYRYLASAIENYDGTGYIQMLADTTEPSIDAAGKTIYLDLNGKTVTLKDGENAGNLKVAKLYGMDSTGNDYDAPDGAIKGTVTAAPVATHYLGGTTPKHYIPVSSNGETSFHRAGVSVTGMQYTTGTDYIIFEGTFRGNNNVVTALQNVGFRFNQNSDTWYDWKDDDVKSDGMTFYYARPIEGTNSVQALLNFGTKTNVSDVAVSLLRNNLSDLLAQVKQS